MPQDDAFLLKADLVRRLRCAEGHLHSIVGMLEAEADCQEVVRQISAVQGALRQVNRRLVSHYIESCLQAGFQESEPTAQEHALSHIVALYTIVGGRRRRL